MSKQLNGVPDMADFDILQGPFTTDSCVNEDDGCDICLDRDVPEAGSPILIATLFADHEGDHTPILLPPKLARKLALIFAAAPELLAACKALLHMPMMTDRTYDAVQAIRKQANAAITKANGDA